MIPRFQAHHVARQVGAFAYKISRQIYTNQLSAAFETTVRQLLQMHSM